MSWFQSIVEFFLIADLLVINVTLFVALIIFAYKYLKQKIKD